MTDWQSALEAVAADYTRGTLERDARAPSARHIASRQARKAFADARERGGGPRCPGCPRRWRRRGRRWPRRWRRAALRPGRCWIAARDGAVTFAADSLLALERATCLEARGGDARRRPAADG